jgi:hypothetical protein
MGQSTITNAPSGTFYVTNTGGRNYQDNIILLVGVASEDQDERQNIAVDIDASGYSWTPHMVINSGPADGEQIWTLTSLTLTKNDYATNANGGVYQTWKFGPSTTPGGYPMYYLQNVADTTSEDNVFNWTAIDLKMGIISNTSYWANLKNNGTVKVDYNIRRTDGGNLDDASTRVAFNVYAYNRYTSQGWNQTLWLNRVTATADTSASGWTYYSYA